MSDFDWKQFGRDFVNPLVSLKRKLQALVPHTGMLQETFAKLIEKIPEGTRAIKITIEYTAVATRSLDPYQLQIRQIVPTASTKTVPSQDTKTIPQQPTDPTRTLLTWREFSDKVGDRIDALALSTITTTEELDIELEMMFNEILELFEDYLWLMMMKGITFATEHMNRLSPKYHFTAGWQPSDDVLLANLLDGCRTYLTNWTADMRQDIAKQIREGIELGETAQQIGVRVSDRIQANKWRGILIARTELMRAFNQAAADRYEKAGFGMVWLTARDLVVCEICEPLEGRPINEKTATVTGGEPVGLLPPIHPSCRCTIKPVLLTS